MGFLKALKILLEDERGQFLPAISTVIPRAIGTIGGFGGAAGAAGLGGRGGLPSIPRLPQPLTQAEVTGLAGAETQFLGPPPPMPQQLAQAEITGLAAAERQFLAPPVPQQIAQAELGFPETAPAPTPTEPGFVRKTLESILAAAVQFGAEKLVGKLALKEQKRAVKEQRQAFEAAGAAAEARVSGFF